ncbi:MAG: hypothetical protein ABR549_11675 [Mycobacteriales bacterium]
MITDHGLTAFKIIPDSFQKFLPPPRGLAAASGTDRQCPVPVSMNGEAPDWYWLTGHRWFPVAHLIRPSACTWVVPGQRLRPGATARLDEVHAAHDLVLASKGVRARFSLPAQVATGWLGTPQGASLT